MDFEEKKKKSEWIYKGKIVNLRKDEAEMPDGTIRQREVVEHSGGAATVAINPDGKILLVRQWRYPFSKMVMEIPAGKLNIGEQPEACAARELVEETGYAARKISKLGELMMSPGFCNEVIHLFFATDLVKTQQCPDEDEFLDVVEMPFLESIKMIKEGVLSDAKTVAGILWAESVR